MTTNQLKQFFFLYKREDFTDAQFLDYWLKPHSALAQKVDPSIHREIVMNIYQEPEQSNSYGSGLVETYHTDEQTIQRLVSEPLFKELIADEPNFVQPGSTRVVATQQEVVIDRAGKAAFGKLLVLCKCAHARDRDRALQSWRGAVRETALRVPEVMGYIESIPTKTSASSPTQPLASDLFDAVGEFYFADDRRRDNFCSSEAFAAFLSEAKSAFGNGSITLLPVIEVQRR